MALLLAMMGVFVPPAAPVVLVARGAVVVSLVLALPFGVGGGLYQVVQLGEALDFHSRWRRSRIKDG